MASTEIEEGVHFFLIISLSKALDNKNVNPRYIFFMYLHESINYNVFYLLTFVLS